MSIETIKQMVNALEHIATSAESRDMVNSAIIAGRQAIAEAEKQDKFCDENCVWTDHHKDCVRSSVSWKDMAFARLGVVRDKMQQDDVATVQRFLDGDYTHPQPNVTTSDMKQEHVDETAKQRHEENT